MNGLDGAVVAVTGAGGGIGEAVCRRLLDEGSTVYALDRIDSPAGQSLLVDITDPDQISRAADAIVRRSGQIDGLVAAAGVVEDDIAAEDMSIEQ